MEQKNTEMETEINMDMNEKYVNIGFKGFFSKSREMAFSLYKLANPQGTKLSCLVSSPKIA